MTTWADHNSLRVTEHGSDVEAALALDVHEEGVGGLDETLLLVLELLELRRRVQQVDVVLENHGGRLGFVRAPRSLISGRHYPKRRRLGGHRNWTKLGLGGVYIGTVRESAPSDG